MLQEIQAQRANSAGLKVPDETLNSALTEVAQRNNIPLSQLPEALSQQGIDYCQLPRGHAQGAHARPAASARRASADQHHAA